jgi:hypothetical protein
MILTAQWVRSLTLGSSGVNAYFYRSPGFQAPVWNHGDEDGLRLQIDGQFQHPGALIGSHLHVPPGGNDVLAFLDVIASEDVTIADLATLLGAGPRGSELRPGETRAWALGNAAARYQADHSLAQVMKTVFVELQKVMLGLFKTGRGEGPLRVQVERAEGGRVFSIDSDSVSRLLRIHGSGWRAPRVSVGDSEADDFKEVRGEDVQDHLVEVLTGLDQAYIRNLGGAEFFDAASGRVLHQWPPDDQEDSGPAAPANTEPSR